MVLKEDEGGARSFEFRESRDWSTTFHVSCGLSFSQFGLRDDLTRPQGRRTELDHFVRILAQRGKV